MQALAGGSGDGGQPPTEPVQLENPPPIAETVRPSSLLKEGGKDSRLSRERKGETRMCQARI